MRAGEFIKQKLGAMFPQALFVDILPENCSTTGIACVYQYASTAPATTLDGGFTGVEAARIQIDLYGPQLGVLSDKADLVIAALENQTELVALYLGRRTLPEPETRRKRLSLDFSIWETP